MNDQGMQFADPEWRPPQRRDVKFDARESETFVPQPINRNASPYQGQQIHTEENVADNTETYTSEPYIGLGPQQLRPDGPRVQENAQPMGHYWPPVRQRHRPRGVGIIILIVVLFFAFSGILSAIFGSVAHFGGPDFKSMGPMHKYPPITYTVTDHPTIVINDTNGSVNINTDGKSGNQVLIQPESRQFGNNQSSGISTGQNTVNNTITVNENGSSTGNTDITVSVPANADLQIHEKFGSIDVNGVTGQMTLETGAGSINIDNSTLTGGSSLKSDAGGIDFTGSLTPHGAYDFTSGAGSVSLNLPANSSFHMDAKTNFGSFSSDFNSLNAPSHSGPGDEVHGDVGTSASDTTVTVKTAAGSIDIGQQ